MHPRFSFEVDRPRNLVRIVLSGLFKPKDVSAFFEARRKAHAELTSAPGQHVTLTDLRTMNVLPQDTVDAFGVLLTDPQSRARRLAFVTAPTLVRSQLARVLAGRDGRCTPCITDPVEAESWLLADSDAPRETISRRGPSPTQPMLRAMASYRAHQELGLT